MPETPEDHDRGLRHDLPHLLKRRETLALLGGVGLAGLALGNRLSASTAVTADAADGSVCVADAPETKGPFPADGTNSKANQTVNVLTQQGVIREDLRPGFAGMPERAEGCDTTLELQLVNVNDMCTPLSGFALYLWHCDAVGKYSLYDYPDRNFLRGVGISDSNCIVRFTTVFPGCYDGRWPHFHFEVFADPSAISTGRDSLLISQLALPLTTCAEVYATDIHYVNGTVNLARQSLTRDMVFSNESDAQTAQRTVAMTGSPTLGYAGTARIGLEA